MKKAKRNWLKAQYLDMISKMTNDEITSLFEGMIAHYSEKEKQVYRTILSDHI